MKRVRPFNGICGLEDAEGSLPTGLESGIPVREKMNITGGITKVNLEKNEYGESREHTNQDQGSSF